MGSLFRDYEEVIVWTCFNAGWQKQEQLKEELRDNL